MAIWQLSYTEFEYLAKDNYPAWKNFMPKLLCCFGQEHWDIVSGKYTRVDAQDKHKFDVNDQIALSTIRIQIDTVINPWVLDQFATSKELWDCIELKFQRKEQKKMKKRAKQKQRKLKHRESTISEIFPLMIPVPEIYDSDSSSFENFLEDFACMATPPQHSGILEKDKDFLTIQMFLDDAGHIAGFNGTSSLGTEMVPVLFKENNMAAKLLDLQALLPERVQQFDVLFLDDFLELADLSSVPQALISDYAGNELVLECIPESSLDFQSIFFDLDLQHEVVDSICLLGNSEITDLFYEEEQCTSNGQGDMAATEEMVCEIPWLEVDSKVSDFQSVLSQVSTYELPLCVNLHIPFPYTHDGNVEHYSSFDDSLGFIAYAEIEGVTKKLQVTYRCLHLRDQVFMVVDLAEDQNLVASHGKSGQCVEEFHEAYYGYKSMVHSHSLSQQFVMALPGQYVEEVYDAYYDSPTLEQLGTAGTSKKEREWYRGKKIWFKIKDNSHSWLLFWLSLLYFLSTA